jgi:hypothetical protein
MKQTFLLLFAIAIHSISIGQSMSEKSSFNGTIGDQPIHLNFYLPENWYNFDSGDYYYDKFKKTIILQGSEQVTGDEKIQKIYEMVDGKKTGYFIFDSPDYFLAGLFDQTTITGKWYSMDGATSHKVTLTHIPGK